MSSGRAADRGVQDRGLADEHRVGGHKRTDEQRPPGRLEERIIELAPESSRGGQRDESVGERCGKHQRVEHAMDRQSLVIGFHHQVVMDDVHVRVIERLAQSHDDPDHKHRESEVDVPLDDIQLALRQIEADGSETMAVLT